MKKLLLSFKDWIKVIGLAIFLALVFKSCLFDVYTIPTTSMVSNISPGDVILVNKFIYGSKIVRSPLSIPFLHKYIPYTGGVKCFSEAISLPYMRLPGISNVERNDLIVFHYPIDDLFPVDHRTYFVKRCIGIPGDKIQLIDDIVLINDTAIKEATGISYSYKIKSDEALVEYAEDFNVSEGGATSQKNSWEFTLDSEQHENFKKLESVTSLSKVTLESSYQDENIFTYNSSRNWNISFYGPVQVPKQGDTIKLNVENIGLYKRLIEIYESHQLSVSPDGEIYIDKQLVDYFVPEMDYYFVLGDNRHNSSDSRHWGFVPEDHIQGRASRVLYSIRPNNTSFYKFNWSRFMKSLH